MHKNRKKPADYPQFTFRVSAETKDELSEKIEEVLDLYNKNLEKDEYLFRKNDIIIDALERGLKDMKAKLPKRKK